MAFLVVASKDPSCFIRLQSSLLQVVAGGDIQKTCGEQVGGSLSPTQFCSLCL